jgi:hypothetical protein
MAEYRIRARTATAIDDEYVATVELADDEKAALDKVLAALAEARADYNLPRLNPRPVVDLIED